MLRGAYTRGWAGKVSPNRPADAVKAINGESAIPRIAELNHASGLKPERNEKMAGYSSAPMFESANATRIANKPRNIANVHELDGFIEEIRSESCSKHSFPSGETWLRTRFRKYMIKEYHDVELLTECVDDRVPGASRINRAIRRSERVYRLRLHAPDAREFRTWITHALDYLRHAQANRRNLPKHLRFREAESLSVDEALNRADKWTVWLQKNAADEEAPDVTKVVHKHADGHRWVEVLTRQALQREGKLMCHCVASYAPWIEQGECTIYSLRDPDNFPHVTMELRGRRVCQVQGKHNQRPALKYLDYVVDLINHMGLELARHSSLREWGFVPYKGRLSRLSQLPKEFWAGPDSEALDLLRQAVDEGNIKLIRHAMESGFSLADSRSAELLSTILSSVLKYSRIGKDFIKLLLDRGAKVTDQDVIRAVVRQDIEVLSLLLESGADPDEALTHAIQRRNAEAVRILLEYGAVPVKRNRRGKCAFDVAERINDPIITDLLRSAVSNRLYKKVRRMRQRGKWQRAAGAATTGPRARRRVGSGIVHSHLSLSCSTRISPVPK